MFKFFVLRSCMHTHHHQVTLGDRSLYEMTRVLVLLLYSYPKPQILGAPLQSSYYRRGKLRARREESGLVNEVCASPQASASGRVFVLDCVGRYQ